MLLNETSLKRVVSLSDVEDEGNLVASKLEEVVVDVYQSVGTLDSDVIEISGSVSE